MQCFKVYLIVKVGDNGADNFGLFVETTIDHKGYISFVETADSAGSMDLVLVDTRQLGEVRLPWNNKRQLGWVTDRNHDAFSAKVSEASLPTAPTTDAIGATTRQWTKDVTKQLVDAGIMSDDENSNWGLYRTQLRR